MASWNSWRILKLVLLTVLVCPARSTTTAAQTEQQSAKPANQEYRSLLAPPEQSEAGRTDPEKQRLYALYGETELGSSGVIAAVYSLESPAAEGEDATYTVYLALIQKSQKTAVLQKVDLTESMPVQTEFPGNFYKMDARVNAFKIGPETPGVHVNLWAALAGTGSVSGATDLFYALGSDNKLKCVLELTGTSKYSRIGGRQASVKDSQILVGDIDGGGSADLIVESADLEIVGPHRHVQAGKSIVYKFVDGRYQAQKEISRGEISKLKLTVLQRSAFIRAVKASQ